MPEHPSEDERGPEPIEELRPNAPVFAVAPVRTQTRVPRVVLVGLVVGVLAFVAGIGVASAGPTPRAGGPSALPVAVPGTPVLSAASPAPPTVAGTADPAATAAAPAGPDAAAPTPASSLAAAGSSAFAVTFRPDRIITATEGGAACTIGDAREKEVPRTRRDGPRLTFQRSWLAWCPVPADRRQAFLLAILTRLVDEVPAQTFGYSATRDGGGDALFPYAEPPLAGTIAVTADAAGDGYAIAIVLEEWRSDQAR